MSIHHWKLSNRKIVAKTGFFDLVSLDTQDPKGKAYTFYRLECVDWVNVLALTAKQEVVLVSQFRAGIEALSLELPGGLIEPAEDPKTAALRELKEETGYATEPENTISLGYILPNPAILNNRCHLFLARDVRCVAPTHWDETESLEIILMPYANFLQQIEKGDIQHSIVLNTVLKYEFLQKQLQPKNEAAHVPQ